MLGWHFLLHLRNQNPGSLLYIYILYIHIYIYVYIFIYIYEEYTTELYTLYRDYDKDIVRIPMNPSLQWHAIRALNVVHLTKIAKWL